MWQLKLRTRRCGARGFARASVGRGRSCDKFAAVGWDSLGWAEWTATGCVKERLEVVGKQE